MHPTWNSISPRSLAVRAPHQAANPPEPSPRGLPWPSAPVDGFEAGIAAEELEELPVEVPESEPWESEFPAEPPLRNRANGWDVLKDASRELASSLRDAYATCCRSGIVEAIRMLTSHLTQLFVGTSAFLIFNLGRRLQALWKQVHGAP